MGPCRFLPFRNRHFQNLSDMQSLASSQALDLLHAAKTIGNDQHILWGFANGREQDAFRDLDRNFVFVGFETKGPRHSATTRVKNLEIEPHTLEEFLLGIEFQHRLVMAVPVNDRFARESRWIITGFADQELAQ